MLLASLGLCMISYTTCCRRSQKAAAASEIKSVAYTTDDVLSLFGSFQQQVNGMNS